MEGIFGFLIHHTRHSFSSSLPWHCQRGNMASSAPAGCTGGELAMGVGLGGSSRVMVAGKGHSSGNFGKEVESLRRGQPVPKPTSLHTCHNAVPRLQKENLAAKGQCETRHQRYRLSCRAHRLPRRERMLFPHQLVPTARHWPLLGMMHWRVLFVTALQPAWRQETSQIWTVP